MSCAARTRDLYPWGHSPMKPTKKPPNALAIFIHARRFRAGYEFILQRNEYSQMSEMGPVVLTLSAFSSELYLKALLCLETGRFWPGHNLKNLFRNLSSASRNRIEKVWDAHFQSMLPKYRAISRLNGLPVPSGNLIDALNHGAQAFEAFRYAFEGDLPDFFIADLPQIMDEVISAIKPDWKALRSSPPTFLGQIDPKLDGGPLPKPGNWG